MGVDQCLPLQPCVDLVLGDAELISRCYPSWHIDATDMILIYRYHKWCKLDLVPDSTHPAAGYVWEHADSRVHLCAKAGDQGNKRTGTRQVHRTDRITVRIYMVDVFSWIQTPALKHILYPMIWDLIWTLVRSGISTVLNGFEIEKLATPSHSGFRSSPLWTSPAVRSQRWRPGVCQRLLPRMMIFLDYVCVA